MAPDPSAPAVGGQPVFPTEDCIFRALAKICETISREGDLSACSTRQLYVLFNKVFASAVAVVDRGDIVRISSRSFPDRCFWKVQGASQTTYHCYGGVCTCEAFSKSVVGRKQHPLCKHLLAVHLAEALRLVPGEELADEFWAEELLQNSIWSVSQVLDSLSRPQ